MGAGASAGYLAGNTLNGRRKAARGMTLNPGEEFRLKATPDQALLLKLAHLANIGSGAVLTSGAGERIGNASSFRAAAERTFEMIRMARLAGPDYQAMSARINGDLERMDENAVDVLQKIEHALTELRLKRERLQEQAYRDENGRPIAMTQDGTAAYYVDDAGGRVDDETFHQIEEYLVGKPPVEEFADVGRQEDELETLRADIQTEMANGDRLREELAAGAISKEEAEQRAGEIQDAMSSTLSATEAALLGVRDDGAAAGVAAPDLAAEDAMPVIAPPKPR